MPRRSGVKRFPSWCLVIWRGKPQPIHAENAACSPIVSVSLCQNVNDSDAPHAVRTRAGFVCVRKSLFAKKMWRDRKRNASLPLGNFFFARISGCGYLDGGKQEWAEALQRGRKNRFDVQVLKSSPTPSTSPTQYSLPAYVQMNMHKHACVGKLYRYAYIHKYDSVCFLCAQNSSTVLFTYFTCERGTDVPARM